MPAVLSLLGLAILAAIVVFGGLLMVGFFAVILGWFSVVFLVSQLTGQKIYIKRNGVKIGYVKWFRYFRI